MAEHLSKNAPPSTLHHQGSEADFCRLRGWGVGTRLVGDEGYGPTIIEITAIGERKLVAKILAHAGRAVRQHEASWVLWCRDWREHDGDVPEPVPVGADVVVTLPDLVDGEPGVIEDGPDSGGRYDIRLPLLRKRILTDKFEVRRGS